MIQLRQTGLTWNVIGDEVVVLDLEGSVYLKLNGSGRALWEHLVEPRSEDELVALLVEQFEITAARATADVEAFVADLRARHLLEA
jgi:hypothetical protein